MGAPVCLEYRIEGNDFMVAGAASNNIKNTLKMLGIASDICRRVAIITYEAEINLVIHAGGGMLQALISEDHVDLVIKDEGPGIADINKAMTAGGLFHRFRGGTDAGLWRRHGPAEYKAQQRYL